MSREIDERIVAMYLDNSDFERNAQKTIKTLEELKNSTNMEGAGKGFQMFDKVKSQLNSVDEHAVKVKKTFASFGDAIKNGVSKVEGPLRTLRGYIAKAIGFDIGNRIVANVENALRSLTVAPISAGWNQYQTSMDSIKTIVSSTGESLDTVKSKMAELTEYANQTVFSLSDMTNNIGKFTNNGVKLDEATRSMIGLANATAAAGQGSQQASMVMYNASQAMGVGKMTTMDWKSFENANVATTDFKNVLIQSAAAAGKLERRVVKVKNETTGLEEEVTQYWTKAAKGQKAVEVNAKNFRETLSKDWLTSDAMTIGYQIYGGMSIEEIEALGNFTHEEAQALHEIGKEALEAASEVRTFSKMMDALKESVQSKIATSYEYIFGDLEEATKFWSDVNDRLDGILSETFDGVNDLLISWRGMMKDENGDVRKIEDVYKQRKAMLEDSYRNGRIDVDVYNRQMAFLENTLGNQELWKDYRDVFVNSLMDTIGIVIDLLKTVGGAMQDAFGTFDLKGLTEGFERIVGSIRNWLGNIDDANSRLNKIRKVLAGVFSIIRVGYTVIKSIAGLVWSIIKPLIKPIIDLFSKLGDWLNIGSITKLGDVISALGDKFRNLWTRLTSLGWKGAFGKIGGWISELWGNIKTGVVTWMNDNGLGGVVDWFRGIRDKIVEGWNAVQEWWNSDGNLISGFFSTIYNTIVGLFKTGHDDNGHETYSPIKQFFMNISSWFENGWKSAKETLQKWLGTSGIGSFFEGIWNSIVGIFKKPKRTLFSYYKLFEGEKSVEIATEEDIPIVAFFKSIGGWLERAWNTAKETLTKWWNGENGEDGVSAFFTNIWDKVSGVFKKGENGEDAPIVEFFGRIVEWIANAWDTVWSTLQTWWNGENGEGGVRDFFANLWETVSGVFEQGPNGETAPIITFFTNIGGWIVEAWNATKETLTDWWNGKDGEGGAKDFFANIWETVSGVFKKPKRTLLTYYKLFEGEKSVEIATGEEIPIVKFLQDVLKGLSDAWKAIVGWEGWASIGKFFSDVWGWISGLFTDEKEVTSGYEASSSIIEKSTEEASDIAKSINSMATVEDSERVEESTNVVQRIFNSLGTMFSKITNRRYSVSEMSFIEKVLASFIRLVELVVGIFSRIIELADRWINGGLSFKDFIDTVLVVIGLFLGNKLLKGIGSAAEGFSGWGSEILKIAAAAALISFALTMLADLNQEELERGSTSLASVMGAVISIAAAMYNLKMGTEAANNPVTPLERVVKRLITFAGIAALLWILVEKLPDIIGAFSEAKKYSGVTGEDLSNLLLGLAGSISILLAAFAVINRILPEGLNIKATFYSVVGMLMITAGILLAVVGNGGVLQLVKKGLDLVGGDYEVLIEDAIHFATSVGRLIGGFIRGIIDGVSGVKTDAQNMLDAQDMVDVMARFADNFDFNKVSKILALSDLVHDLATYTEGVNADSFKSLADSMGYIGSGIVSFVDAVTDEGNNLALYQIYDDPTFEKVKGAIDVVKSVFDMVNAIPNGFYGGMAWDEFKSLTNDEERMDELISGINRMIEKLKGVEDSSDIKFDGVLIITRLYESISQAMSGNESLADKYEFNTLPLVMAIADSLSKHKPFLASIIRGFVQDSIDEQMGTKKTTASETSASTMAQDAGKIVTNVATNNLPDWAKKAAKGYSGIQQWIRKSGIAPFYSGFDIPGIRIPNEYIWKPIYHALTGTEYRAAGFWDTYMGNNGAGSSVVSEILSDLVYNQIFSKFREAANIEINDAGSEVADDVDKKVDQIYRSTDDLVDGLGDTLKYAENQLLGMGATKVGEGKYNFNGFELMLNPTQVSGEDATVGYEDILGAFGLSKDADGNYVFGDGSSIKLSFVPVIVMDDFQGQYDQLQSVLKDQAPLEMHANILMDENGRIPIDDAGILEGLRAVQNEVSETRMAMSIAVNSMATNLSNRIDSLGYRISQMKLYLDSGVLVGGILGQVDRGLYRSAMNSGHTGVSDYPNYVP